MEQRSDCPGVVRRIVEIAAHWNSFHLADDEFAARATVQKAREVLGTIELMEVREAEQRELARKAGLPGWSASERICSDGRRSSCS